VVRVQFSGVALPVAIGGEVDVASTMSPRQRQAHPCPRLGRASKPVQQTSALPIPAAETYTAHFAASPAVQSNEVYPTPCTTVPSISFASASDKRYSLGDIGRLPGTCPRCLNLSATEPEKQ